MLSPLSFSPSLLLSASPSRVLPLGPLAGAIDERTVVVTLTPGARDHFIGCPAQSLVVIRR